MNLGINMTKPSLKKMHMTGREDRQIPTHIQGSKEKEKNYFEKTKYV